jgi:hypothetical protein
MHGEITIFQMTVGYFLANGFGFILPICLLTLLFKQNQPKKGLLHEVLIRTYESFFFTTLFLCFSLQIAAWVALFRTGFGINTTSMGAYTVEITWEVAVLAFVPLVYGFIMPDLFDDFQEDGRKGTKWIRRFALYMLCFILTLFPFVDSLVSIFGPSQIANTPNAAINVTNWSIIEGICLQGVHTLTKLEENARQGFLVFSWLFLYAVSIGKIVYLSYEQAFDHLWASILQFYHRPGMKISPRVAWSVILVTILFFLSVSQLWSYLRLQEAQKQMSAATSNADSDNQWTFGQIVAVSVFTPTLVETITAYISLKQPQNATGRQLKNDDVTSHRDSGVTENDIAGRESNTGEIVTTPLPANDHNMSRLRNQPTIQNIEQRSFHRYTTA